VGKRPVTLARKGNEEKGREGRVDVPLPLSFRHGILGGGEDLSFFSITPPFTTIQSTKCHSVSKPILS